jgi:hypothetical protein
MVTVCWPTAVKGWCYLVDRQQLRVQRGLAAVRFVGPDSPTGAESETDDTDGMPQYTEADHQHGDLRKHMLLMAGQLQSMPTAPESFAKTTA